MFKSLRKHPLRSRKWRYNIDLPKVNKQLNSELTVLILITIRRFVGQFEDLKTFVTVAQSGSITKASEQLDTAKSAISRRLNDLEEKVGVKLLTRTTRQQQLTEAGRVYLDRAEEIVNQMEQLHDSVTGSANEVEGWVRISAPLSIGSGRVSEAVKSFMKIYPKVRVHLSLADSRPNIISDKYDIGILVGNLPDSTMIAKRLMSFGHVLCASPAYLKDRGHPNSISEICQFDYLQYAGLHITDPLSRMLQQIGEKQELNITFESNNGLLLKDLAVSGHGIVMLPSFIANNEINNGRLTPILKDVELPRFAVSAIYPERKYLPLRCRLLIEHLVNWFSNYE